MIGIRWQCGFGCDVCGGRVIEYNFGELKRALNGSKSARPHLNYLDSCLMDTSIVAKFNYKFSLIHESVADNTIRIVCCSSLECEKNYIIINLLWFLIRRFFWFNYFTIVHFLHEKKNNDLVRHIYEYIRINNDIYNVILLYNSVSCFFFFYIELLITKYRYKSFFYYIKNFVFTYWFIYIYCYNAVIVHEMFILSRGSFLR